MNSVTRFTAALIVGMTCTNFAVAQMATPELEAVTPKPITPVWESERDLVVLVDEADDRAAMARLIMATSLEVNSGLTPLQRFDGLTIAGHTLYNAGIGALPDAVICFNGAMGLGVSDDSVADSARMKAQCLFWLGEYDQATTAYLVCYDISKQLELAYGNNNLSDLVVVMLIQSARRAGNHDIVVQITNNVLADTTLNPKTRSDALDIGGMGAFDAGNSERAEVYFAALLSEYTDYGIEYPGNRVNIEMNLLKAQGLTLANKDSVAFIKITELIQSEQYRGMPCWTWPVAEMADILDSLKIQKMAEANKLRLWAVDQLDLKADSYDLTDPNADIKRLGTLSARLGLLQSAARSFANQRQYDKQADVLNRIITSFIDTDPVAADSANAELQSLIDNQLIQTGP